MCEKIRTRRTPLLLFIVGFLIAGCGPSEARRQHEEHAKSVIECFEEYADDLESVTDDESARYAAIRMEKTNARLNDLIETQDEMLKISDTDSKEIDKLYAQRFKDVRARISKASKPAATQGKNVPAFTNAFDKMKAAVRKVRF